MRLFTSRLYFKTLLWVAPFTIGALITSLLVSNYYMKKMLSAYVPALNIQTVENAALKVDMYIKSAQVLLKNTSEDLANETSPFRLRQRIVNLLLSEPRFSNVYIVDASGTEIASVNDIGGEQKRRAKPHIRTALLGRTGYSEVFFSRNNIPSFEICVPMERWRRITGALCGTLDFTAVWILLDHIKMGHTGYVILASAHGDLLAHPDRSKVLRKKKLTGIPHSALRATRNARLIRTSRGELITFTTIPGLGWKIIMRQDAHEVYGHYESMIRYAFILIAALIPLTLIGLAFYSFQLTRPIFQLISAAEIFATGNLDYRVVVHGRDEIGLLAKALNRMSADLKKSRHMLIQAEKLSSIGRFAASIAHELKTPIAGLSSYTYLLKENPTPDELREYAGEMQENLARIDKTLERLMQMTRKNDYAFGPVALNDLISRCVRLLDHHIMRLKKTAIHTVYQDPLPVITGDTNLIQQVFVNLLLNACEAIPEGGEITVTTRSENDRILVTISDTGPGVAPEHRERVFEPFYTTKTDNRNTGLGLYIAREIMTLHGGGIRVSENNGQGAVFALTFETRASGGASL
jgi:two-component system, NtrC family, sensor kinase